MPPEYPEALFPSCGIPPEASESFLQVGGKVSEGRMPKRYIIFRHPASVFP